MKPEDLGNKSVCKLSNLLSEPRGKDTNTQILTVSYYMTTLPRLLTVREVGAELRPITSITILCTDCKRAKCKSPKFTFFFKYKVLKVVWRKARTITRQIKRLLQQVENSSYRQSSCTRKIHIQQKI